MSTFDQPNKTTTAEKILEMQPSPNLNTLFFISEKKKKPKHFAATQTFKCGYIKHTLILLKGKFPYNIFLNVKIIYKIFFHR